jgi:hypothetical protein
VSNPTTYGPIKTSGTALSNRGTTNARNGNTNLFESKKGTPPDSLNLNVQLIPHNLLNQKIKTKQLINITKKPNLWQVRAQLPN